MSEARRPQRNIVGYDLLQPSADISRARAAELNRGRRRSYNAVGFGIDTTLKVCECERPWSNGEGSCVTCGKHLRKLQLGEVGRL